MKTFRSKRAFAGVETLALVLLIGGAAKLAGWKPSNLWRKPPPTAQVTQLQADLAKAQAELEAARLAKAEADKAERAKMEEQVRWSQQMNEGAAEALRRIPAEHRTAEGQLAADLVNRANFGLAAAIGKLPAAQQREILDIVEKALSGVQEERDAALAALKQKDQEIRLITTERDQVKASIPVLEAKLDAKEAATKAVQAELNVKTTEVNTFAAKADARERDNGSLSAALQRLIAIVVCIACAWLFAAYGMPPLLKLMRPGRAKNILRNVSGYATGGLHFHDAKKKLARGSVA